MAKRRDEGMDEVQIVVERVGYGRSRWRWRLANECGLTIDVGSGFPGPEGAYASAQKRLSDLRTGAASDMVNSTAKKAPVERKKRCARTSSEVEGSLQRSPTDADLQQGEGPLMAPEFIPHFTRAKQLAQLSS